MSSLISYEAIFKTVEESLSLWLSRWGTFITSTVNHQIQVNAVSDSSRESFWHCRYGHLGERNLHRLSCEWFQLQRVKTNWFM